MIRTLRFTFAALYTFAAFFCYAQKPNISYPSPQIYKVGTAVTLSPTNTGGAVDPITPVVVASGLNNPTSVAADALGNLYVTANGSSTVVKIATDGTQTNIGSGFNHPTGVAVDAAGNVYVADHDNNAIKKIPAGGGAITTIGSGFSGPYGIAIDANGMLYVSDRESNQVKKLPSTGGTPVVIGSGFNAPAGVAVDNAGNVYVADRGHNLIKKIVAGTGSIVNIGYGDANPTGVAVNAAGDVYFSDASSSALREYIGGAGTSVNIGSGFATAAGLALINTVIYVVDNGHSQIKKFSPGFSGYTIDKKLPAGLSFNVNKGVISGTPTAATAATDYTITGANAQGVSTAVVNIRTKFPAAPAISYPTPQVFAFRTAITPVKPTNKGGDVTGYYSVTPALPAGLYVDYFSGEITGTPNVGSPPANYTVTASNPGGTGSAVINIAVTPPPKPVISYPTPPTFTAGVAINPIYGTNTGGPIDAGKYTISPALPPGLYINSYSGEIYGTPTAAQPATAYKISARNTGGTGSTTINITVVLPPKPVIAYSGSQIFTVGAASAILPTNSGGFVSPGGYSITPQLTAGLYFDTNSGLVSGTPTAASVARHYTITASNPGGSSTADLKITVVLPPKPVISYPSPTAFLAGTFSAINPTNTGGPINYYGYSITPQLPDGIYFSPYDGTISGTATALSAATDYTVTAINPGGSGSAVVKISVVAPPKPVIGYNIPQNIVAGQTSISVNPTNTGGPASYYGWSITPALPQGLNFETFNGAIYGTPAAVQPATKYTVTAKNLGGSGTTVVTLAVTAPPKPVISFVQSLSFVAGTFTNTVSPTISGGFVSPGGYSITPQLPQGLYFDSNYGYISGTPGVASPPTDYTITARNPGGASSVTVNITVTLPPKPVISYTSPQTLIVNTYATGLNAINTGGPVPANGYSSVPALPNGLYLNSDGSITGAPTTPQSAKNYTITATNLGGSSTATINIAVALPQKPALAYHTPNVYIMGSYIATLYPSNSGGAVSSYNYSITPELPQGLYFSAYDGSIYGNPTAVSPAKDYTVTASNAGGTGAAVVNIAVTLPPKAIVNYPTPQTLTAGYYSYINPSVTGTVSYGGYSISPALPAGLNFDPYYGEISGSANDIQAAKNYTVTAKNAGGNSTAVISIKVVAPQKPNITYPSPQAFTVGSYNDTYPTNSGGRANANGYSITPQLPAGLTLDANSGYISGTPTAASPAANYTVTATNLGGTSSTVINIATILPQKPVINYVSPQILTQNVFSNNGLRPINTGGPVSGGYTISPALPSGLYLSSYDGSISGAPTFIQPATDYTVTATNAAGSGTAIVNIAVVTPPKPVISYQSPQVYTTGVSIKSLSPLNTGGNIINYPYTINPQLPQGLYLDGYTGSIYGTPSAVSPATDYTITARNGGGTSTFTVNIAVKALVKPAIYYQGPQEYYANTAISALIPVNSGGPVNPGTFSITPQLPTGLNFDTNSGQITGVPTVSTPQTTYTISAVNMAGSSSTTLVITVKQPKAPFLSYTSPNVFIAGTAIKPLAPSNGGDKPVSGYSSTTITTNLGYYSNVITVNAAGNIFAIQQNSGILREINGAGASRTIASGFINPTALTADNSGNVYVFENTAPFTLIKVPMNGGPAVTVSTGLPSIYSMVADGQGNIYFTSTNDADIKKISAGGGSPVAVAKLSYSYSSITLDPSGNIYVVQPSGQISKILAGKSVLLPVYASGDATNIAVDGNGNVYFSNQYQQRIEVLYRGATTAVILNSDGLSNLNSLFVDSKGTLYLYYSYSQGLRKLSPLSGYFISPTLPDGLTIDQTTGIITGTPASGSPATDYMVTGYNTGGPTTASVNIKVTPNVTLSALAISSGTLAPKFTPLNTFYNAAVDGTAESVTLTPTASKPTSVIEVNGVQVTSGTPSPAVQLIGDKTIIPIMVKTPDGSATQVYNVTVSRGLSSNAVLLSLKMNGGDLLPAFSAGTTKYTASVGGEVRSVTFAPVTSDPEALIKINDIPVASGSVSAPISLNQGVNTLTVSVLAANGVAQRTYTITITRAQSSNSTLAGLSLSHGTLLPGFSSATLTYTATVPANVASTSVIPVSTDAAAVVNVNGAVVSTGNASADIALTTGPNTITVVVTSPDGTTTTTYTLVVTRAAASTNNVLLSLIPDQDLQFTPVFSAGTAKYTTNVISNITGIAFTPETADPNATVTINGLPVQPGTLSQSIRLVRGPNVITVVVTAQDGISKRTYTLTITKAAAADARLSWLSLDQGSLAPYFNQPILYYNATVPFAATGFRLFASAMDPNATVKVNGVVVDRNLQSQVISIGSDLVVLTIVVTAEDGVTTQTYTVRVTKAPPSNNATVWTMWLFDEIMNEIFAASPYNNNHSFQVAVPYRTSFVKLETTVADATAKINVNGELLTNYGLSSPIQLKPGANTITVLTTAEDGVTTQTNTITVTRAMPLTNALLTSLELNSATLSPAFSAGTARYTATVSNTTATISVIPTTADNTATVQVNGVAVISGATSQAIPLAVGSNVISTIITAQDGVTKRTYTVTVTRSAPAANVLTADAVNSATEDTDVTVHQSLSPNGDGNNDVLLIDGIAAYPDNNLVIFDRNGVVVFDAKGYNNGTIVFDGHYNKGAKMLPAGTYLYALDYKAPDGKKHKTGYILLKY